MDEYDLTNLAIKKVVEALKDEKDFVVLHRYAEPEAILVQTWNATAITAMASHLPAAVEVQDDDGRTVQFTVKVQLGPKIEPIIRRESPVLPAAWSPAQGGDWCGITGGQGAGTVGVAVWDITAEYVTRTGQKYSVSASHAFLSNNHVIADHDMAPIGTLLYAGAGTAKLAGFWPLAPVLVSADFAVGGDLSPGTYAGGMLNGLGQISGNFATPTKGLNIRKSGAASGVTSGTITGNGCMVTAGGHNGAQKQYYEVFETTPKFADFGDSGSIVVNAGMDILGMVTWGSGPDSPSYFWTFKLPGTQKNKDRINCRIKIG